MRIPIFVLALGATAEAWTRFRGATARSRGWLGSRSPALRADWAVIIVLMSFLAAMIVLAGAEWGSRGPETPVEDGR